MCVISYYIQLFLHSSHRIHWLDVYVCVVAIMSVLWAVGFGLYVRMRVRVSMRACVSQRVYKLVIIHIGVSLLVFYNYYNSMPT